ncbi:MAG: hypothetical protein DDT32_01192 [Syntrophomonadaceae bacterium]|nr:hypothetical protein [Bacillota bacterium]
MEQQGKLEVLRYLSELAIKEADLIWLRYQTMLIASTGLIAILGYSIDKHIIWVSYAVSILGVVLALVWLQIHRLSQFYYQRWQLDADEIVKSDAEFAEWIRGRLAPRIARPSNISASGYANILPVAFLIGWCVILITLLLNLI